MKMKTAVAALSALAQENRLAAFRALVEAGPSGLCPSELSEKVKVAAPTLSFHLARLRQAKDKSKLPVGRKIVAAVEKSCGARLRA